MRRVRVSYEGRVQGVGFRATSRSIASGFEVTGWVRNEADRSVTLEAQGPEAQVDGLLEAIRGRFGQSIRGEVVEEIPLREGESGFRIER